MPGPLALSSSTGIESSSEGVSRLLRRGKAFDFGFNRAFGSYFDEEDMVEVGVSEPLEGDPGTDAPGAAQLGVGAFFFLAASSDELSERCSGDIVEER